MSCNCYCCYTASRSMQWILHACSVFIRREAHFSFFFNEVKALFYPGNGSIFPPVCLLPLIYILDWSRYWGFEPKRMSQEPLQFANHLNLCCISIPNVTLFLKKILPPPPTHPPLSNSFHACTHENAWKKPRADATEQMQIQ